MPQSVTDFSFLGYYLLAAIGCGLMVILLKYIVRKQNIQNQIVNNVITWVAIGNIVDNTTPTEEKQISREKYIVKILIHFVLINVAYISWGILQERMITIEYKNPETGESSRFQQSDFIVLSNRVLAMVISGAILLITKYRNRASRREWKQQSYPPLYKYGYSSLSNLVSSWSQYEALKYVSFPFQVLAKSCKIVPVMIMGTIVSRKVYTLRQYLSALCLTVGISLFTYSTGKSKGGSGDTEFYLTLLGYFLLAVYFVGDSFTSNWQSELYKKYKITSIEMMFNSSVVSVVLILFSFCGRGFSYPYTFIKIHPVFLYHLFLCALTSSIGQVFIFYAIKDVGPVVFTGIMVTKSLISMMLSCIIYKHVIPTLGLVGVGIVFGILYLEFSLHLKRR